MANESIVLGILTALATFRFVSLHAQKRAFITGKTAETRNAIGFPFGSTSSSRQTRGIQMTTKSSSSSPKSFYPTNVKSLARYIQSDECQSISVLTGAGISVASGIPDFRSPGGMYDTLRPELITASPAERRLMEQDPTYVVSWNIFKQNAFPYLEVRRPFILGTQQQKWKATLGHWFFDLLQQKLPQKLTRIYTQNIDGLFYQLDHVPKNKIVDVHGTIANASCEMCLEPMDFAEFCDQVRSNIKDIYKMDETAPKKSKPICCKDCGAAAVKPTTVLFGRSLPAQFFDLSQKDMPQTDLLLVAGTSLVVSPANFLVPQVKEDAARVLINLEPAGEHLGFDPSPQASGREDDRDLFLQGSCDEIFLDLVKELGWLDDLKAIADKFPAASAELLASNI